MKGASIRIMRPGLIRNHVSPLSSSVAQAMVLSVVVKVSSVNMRGEVICSAYFYLYDPPQNLECVPRPAPDLLS